MVIKVTIAIVVFLFNEHLLNIEVFSYFGLEVSLIKIYICHYIRVCTNRTCSEIDAFLCHCL